MPFVQVNDLKIYYEEYGAGTPLLLVMGLGATVLGWSLPQVKRLATKHRVILFDNRGAGQTDKPRGPYTMPQLAADAVGLLDALSIDRAHVFGVSMGGMIVQHIALDYPQRVRSLILGCTGAGGKHVVRTPPDSLKVLTAETTGDRAEDIRRGWQIMYTPEFIAENRDLLEEKLRRELAYPEQPRYAFEAQMAAIAVSHNTFDRLPELKMPVLIQVGEKDILIPPENADILAGQIKHAKVIRYPNAGHGYFLETGFRAADDVLAFLEEVERNERMGE